MWLTVKWKESINRITSLTHIICRETFAFFYFAQAYQKNESNISYQWLFSLEMRRTLVSFRFL